MPTFTHDCKRCRFLATVQDSKLGTVDLYFHPGAMPTIVLRHGSKGPEYTSFPYNMVVRGAFNRSVHYDTIQEAVKLVKSGNWANR